MTTIYGAILEKGEPYFTIMSNLMNSLPIVVEEYNWLISNYMIYEIDEIPWNEQYTWLTGEELADVLEKTPGHQWIWAAVSGFDKSISKEEVLQFPLPNPECRELWTLPLELLHPKASIEIIAWDSSLTIVKSQDITIINTFRYAFPLSEDLATHNSQY